MNNGEIVTDYINPNKFIEEVGRNYYNYKGSLTTPSCNEAVSWIIMECTIPITAVDVSYTFLHRDWKFFQPHLVILILSLLLFDKNKDFYGAF